MLTTAAQILPRQPIADEIHAKKYAFKGEDLNGTFDRVAAALYAKDPRAAEFMPLFRKALAGFEFMPGGRIIAGAGTGRSVTLFNCYVMGALPDSIEGIFQMIKEGALTMQQGGGIGIDFSPLRPKGAPVHGVDADASGPLSFMDVTDSMCRTVESAGERRGAMMATMRCDHPDIEAFIDAKREPGRLRMFNLSVLVTDAFMEAVDADAEWPLVFGGETYRTLPARALWDKIMQATYAYAEPGVIFIDRINALNNLHYVETISATNPCGEVPLPPYGACLLGSINLAALVRHPFTADAHLDMARLQELVPVAVRTLDNVIEISNFPLPQQKQEAENKRRMGMGVTGLADALLMCGIAYGSDEAEQAAEEWLGTIERLAYLASSELATERGSFPLFDADQYLAGGHVAHLPADVRRAIKENGIRNSHLMAFAPTGTISMFAGNVSSGIEPVFSWCYERRLLQGDGSHLTQMVYDPAYLLYCTMNGMDPDAKETLANLPAAFVDAQTLPPAAHIRMQAVAQRHVDQSISKTVNLPEDISFEAFQAVYRDAYRSGCKGCTTYRPNPVTGAVLTVKKDEPAAAPQPTPAPQAAVQAIPAKRPGEIDGRTYKVANPETDENIYITINHVADPATGCESIFEVFANTYDSNAAQILNAATLAISLAYQSGDTKNVTKLLDRYAKVRGDLTLWHDGHSFTSLLPLLVHVIRTRAAELAADCATRTATPAAAAPQVRPQHAPHAHGPKCPKCGSTDVKFESGCMSCRSCLTSKCG